MVVRVPDVQGLRLAGRSIMTQLNENDRAVLELLVMKPRDFFPPMALKVARKLSRRGLAICRHGEWYVTAAGLREAHHQLH
jgi:hypothetical protein